MGISWSDFDKKIHEDAKNNGVPLIGCFELTSRCNLRCKMCYINQGNDLKVFSKELKASKWISLAQEAKEQGMLYLLLTGGEVFVREDFKEIYEAIASMGFLIRIYTNGTLITNNIVSFLAKNPPIEVGVTLYGSSKKSYEKICGNPNAYDLALNGIDLLLQKGIKVEIRTTVVRDNANDFYDLARYAEDRGLMLKIVNYVHPSRNENCLKPQEVRLSPKELVNYELMVMSYYMRHKTKLCRSFEEYKFSKLSVPRDLCEVLPCGAGLNSFIITWDGKLAPCSSMESISVSVLEEDFRITWQRLRQLCLEVPSSKDCYICLDKEYCSFCPGRLKLETGKYDQPASYLCELARLRKVTLNKWRIENEKILCET